VSGIQLKWVIIFIVLTFSLSLKSFAEDADFLDLSLEELMHTKVSVSSSFQQSLKSTPGIVRVISKEAIASNGWQNLQQLLMHIPGVQISVSKNGHSNIWMRGVQNRNNNKVLLLIDGVPQHDLYYGNFNINKQIPLQAIEKVEVLNGPGGVVHGANSFAGVIAITTKSQGKSVGVNVSQQASYTSNVSKENVYQGQIYTDSNWQTALGDFYFFTSALKDDGFQPQYNRRGEFVGRDASSESYNVLAKYQYQSFDMQLNYSDYAYPYRFTKAERWQGYDKQILSISANYSQQISSNVELKLSGYHKQYDFSRPKEYYEDGLVESSGESLHDTSSQGVDAVFLWPVSAQRHVSFGLNFNRDWSRKTVENLTEFSIDSLPIKTSEQSLIENASRRVFGVFTEFQQEIFLQHWLHLGLRYDDLSDFDNQLNYRISITKESDNFYYKFLFGTSYRVPSYREYLKKYNDDYNQKNLLNPEEMKTIELAVGYNFEHHDLSLVWYSNHYENFIKEVNINSVDGIVIDSGGGDEYGFNFDEIEVNGLELTWLWELQKSLLIKSSLSYLLDASENPGVLTQEIVSPEPISAEKTDLMFMSDFTATFEVNYQFSKRYQLYWDLIYYGDRSVPSNYQDNSSVLQKKNADYFLLSNVNLQIAINDKTNLSFAINNIFDENIYSPTPDPASDYDSQWARRQLQLSVLWQF